MYASSMLLISQAHIAAFIKFCFFNIHISHKHHNLDVKKLYSV